jgi:multiple sugar transport system permease protein
MFYNLVIGIIAALQTFDTVYVLQNTQTENSLASAAYALFTRTFRQLYIGEGSAISWILVIIIMTITVIQFRFSGWVYYEA